MHVARAASFGVGDANTASPTPNESRTPSPRGKRWHLFVWLLLGLVIVSAASVTIGTNPLSLAEVWRGLTRPDDSEAAIIVWNLRGPRTLTGILTGAAFGVAGALIQALTRNPLADPGILGVNAGAGFALTIGVAVFGVSAAGAGLWFAYLGAALATTAVTLLGGFGRGRVDPITLVLAGVALSATLGGITTFLTLIDERTFRSAHGWGLGALTLATPTDLLAVAPGIFGGLVLALVIARPLNAIALGDDLAASLGTRTGMIRVFCIVAITLLAGSATAITGGLSLVGLMVPHIIRWFTGPDQRWIICGSLLCGPILVLLADITGRVVAHPSEMQAGILTALIGAPVLIALVRRPQASDL